MSIHLSDDQLLDRLYGIAAAESHAHLDECPECQVRWTQMQQRRAQSVPGVPSPEFFHRQQREVYSQIARKRTDFRAVWVPATLGAALMAGLFMTRTAPRVSTPVQDTDAGIVEAGWFEDTYSATRELEPRAASPIRELFVSGPAGEGTVLE